MKKLFLILMASMSLFAVKAQDKIITVQKDTIECRIISVNADRISYEQKTSVDQVTGKSIATSEVLQYFRKGGSENFNAIILRKSKPAPPEHRWVFSLQGGLAHSFTDYSDIINTNINNGAPAAETKDYFKKIKNGYHINSNIHYLFTTFLGVGVDYNFFWSAADGEFIANGFSNLNVPIYSINQLNEKLYIHFAGPSVMFQQLTDKKRKIRITETLSPGVVFFREEARNSEYSIYWGNNTSYAGEPPQYYEHMNYVLSNTTFGVKAGLSAEYYITQQLSAGIAGNFMWANLHKISVKSMNQETKNQKLNEALNISHIDYGISFRYSF